MAPAGSMTLQEPLVKKAGSACDAKRARERGSWRAGGFHTGRRVGVVLRRCPRRNCPRHQPRRDGRQVWRRFDGLEPLGAALDELVVAGAPDPPRAAAAHLLDDPARRARLAIARDGTSVEG